MKINNKIQFFSFSASAAVLALFLAQGIEPQPNPVRPNEYLVQRNLLTEDDWRALMRRNDFIFLGFTFIFATSGSTMTLPADFNIANNIVYCIGAGQPGGNGTDAFFCIPVMGGSCGGGGGGCAGGCGTWVDGNGGTGGGGGACAEIVNYSLHAAGQGVPIQVGANATWFHSDTTVFAPGAGPYGNFGGTNQDGGKASHAVGTTKISGSDGGFPTGTGSRNGGTGGTAAGPSTLGGNPLAGAGGAGGAGGIPGAHGSNGNPFGAGGGGGGGGLATTGTGGAAGSGYQGVIAIQYLSTGGFRTFFTSAF